MSIDVRTPAPGIRTPHPDIGAPHPGVSAAFLAEVRIQRAEALDQLERAASSLDEWTLSAARGRLRDLEELLDRNDAGRASGVPCRSLDARGCA